MQFRRAEHFFARKKFRDAESCLRGHRQPWARSSEYYELALYKLGWSLYKQEFYEEALHQYFALLDYKVSIGYDFDAQHEEAEERRVEDTFQRHQPQLLQPRRTGGHQRILRDQRPPRLRGPRLSHLGEFYLDEASVSRRRQVYNAFVALYPFHAVVAALQHARDRDLRARRLPETGARLEEGRSRATTGFRREYWRHFDVGAVARSARLTSRAT